LYGLEGSNINSWSCIAPESKFSYCFRTGKAQASRKEFMSRRISNPVILINHWRWLEANGYKRQAASCKRQAASLTRKYYNDIQEIKGERRNENN